MFNYEMRTESVALAVWERSTGNGRDLDRDMWDEHMANCHAAAANTYREGISDKEWFDLALSRVTS